MIAGFEVIVVDDRESYANSERFPDAREVIADDFERVTQSLLVPESAYIVIVTRGHRDGMRILRIIALFDGKEAACFGLDAEHVKETT